MPVGCRAAYQRYTANLNQSVLAASTRVYHARYVRRFLRWLPDSSTDVGTVLSQPTAWDAAVAAFTGQLAAANGPLSPGLQAHRSALADCARRLGLARPYVPVPGRFGWVDGAYTAAAAASGQAAATCTTNHNAVRAFLRWLDRTGYTGDLRSGWDTATTRYLQHLSARGNAPATVLRQRAALNDCATRLHLPHTTLPRPQPPTARAGATP